MKSSQKDFQSRCIWQPCSCRTGRPSSISQLLSQLAFQLLFFQIMFQFESSLIISSVAVNIPIRGKYVLWKYVSFIFHLEVIFSKVRRTISSLKMVSLFQVAGIWNLRERRWKYKMMAFLSSVNAEMYRTHCLQHLLGCESAVITAGWGRAERAEHQPSSFLKNTNPFHCPWMKWLTDMLNLLNMYFANFEMSKNAM